MTEDERMSNVWRRGFSRVGSRDRPETRRSARLHHRHRRMAVLNFCCLSGSGTKEQRYQAGYELRETKPS
jgi:hypothetical protein